MIDKIARRSKIPGNDRQMSLPITNERQKFLVRATFSDAKFVDFKKLSYDIF
jgi:hypothetical protein